MDHFSARRRVCVLCNCKTSGAKGNRTIFLSIQTSTTAKYLAELRKVLPDYEPTFETLPEALCLKCQRVLRSHMSTSKTKPRPFENLANAKAVVLAESQKKWVRSACPGDCFPCSVANSTGQTTVSVSVARRANEQQREANDVDCTETKCEGDSEQRTATHAAPPPYGGYQFTHDDMRHFGVIVGISDKKLLDLALAMRCAAGTGRVIEPHLKQAIRKNNKALDDIFVAKVCDFLSVLSMIFSFLPRIACVFAFP